MHKILKLRFEGNQCVSPGKKMLEFNHSNIDIAYQKSEKNIEK